RTLACLGWTGGSFHGPECRRGKGFRLPPRYPETMDLRALVDRDIALTERALGKAKIAVPERSHLRKVAEDFVTMARAYYADAKHFRDAAELDKAIVALPYIRLARITSSMVRFASPVSSANRFPRSNNRSKLGDRENSSTNAPPTRLIVATFGASRRMLFVGISCPRTASRRSACTGKVRTSL